MYKCLDCKEQFAEPKIIQQRDEGFINPHTSGYICPWCDSDDIYEMEKCECCKYEHVPQGVDYCESCDLKVFTVLNELVSEFGDSVIDLVVHQIEKR